MKKEKNNKTKEKGVFVMLDRLSIEKMKEGGEK